MFTGVLENYMQFVHDSLQFDAIPPYLHRYQSQTHTQTHEQHTRNFDACRAGLVSPRIRSNTNSIKSKMKLSNSKSRNSKYRRITDYRECNLNNDHLSRAGFRAEREAQRAEQRARRKAKRNKINH